MSLRTFNDSEMRIIREVIDRVRSSSTSSPAQFYSVQTISQSEECFVALPQDTVPGLSRAGGTGTGTSGGVEPSDDDEPGWAYCDIYRIQPNGVLYSGAGTSADPPPDFALVHKDQLVFNLSESELDREWTVVSKTKFGQWVFVGGVPASTSEGVLKGALSGPGCLTDVPTSVEVTVYVRDRETKRLEATTETMTVYNCDPDLEGVPGAYCRWKRIGGMLQFTHISCSDSLEGCEETSGSSSGRVVV